MSREVLLLINALANEKYVDDEIVFEAVEAALASAAAKKLRLDHVNIHVDLNRENGDYTVERRWQIVEGTEDIVPSLQKTLSEVLQLDPKSTLKVGDYYSEVLPDVQFGRIGAQTAKRTILQRIRDAERAQVLNEFLQRKENLIIGTVRRLDRQGVIVEIGRLEALLPNEQLIPRENFRVGDRVRAMLLKIEQRGHRAEIILTRTSKEFLAKLFELEIPEIEDGSIEIKGISRDPGIRSKIAVKSSDPRIDPQGTCIGVRSTRIKNISNALNGERIDVVLWSPEPAQFIINALSPTTVRRILINEDKRNVDVIVDEEELPIAIGRNGQNVRLASELTGWYLKILTSEEAEKAHHHQDKVLKDFFIKHLDIDDEVAEILVQEGFISLEEIAYVPIEELLAIEEFDEELVNELRDRARNEILIAAMVTKEKLKNIDPKIKALTNMTDQLLKELIQHDINTIDDLAELSTPELTELTSLSAEDAGQLILEARSHWFEEGEMSE